ncbi:unnamed protein product [Closterium sp. NIES-53]
MLLLHYDRGGDFSSCLSEEICRDEGITQSFMIPASPKHNGIAECRIVLIMKVARTSMIHAADSHFLWLFAVRYAAHQLNLWLRDCEPETSPTLCWMGEVGDASPFWVSVSLALVHDTTPGKLSSRTIHCIFLRFPVNAPDSQFYHPVTRHFLGAPPTHHPAADDTAVSRHSPRLETPSGFPPQRSLLPLQLVAADFNAAGGGDSGGVSNICY